MKYIIFLLLLIGCTTKADCYNASQDALTLSTLCSLDMNDQKCFDELQKKADEAIRICKKTRGAF